MPVRWKPWLIAGSKAEKLDLPRSLREGQPFYLACRLRAPRLDVDYDVSDYDRATNQVSGVRFFGPTPESQGGWGTHPG